MVGIGNGVGDEAGDRVRHALEHDGETAGVDERHRVVDDRARRFKVLALHPEPAQRVERLRGEPEVAHHRDLGVEDRLHGVEALAAAFELHRAGTGADEPWRRS